MPFTKGTRPLQPTLTWNTCPACGHQWTDRIPTLGVVHRTQRCAACRRLPVDATIDSDRAFPLPTTRSQPSTSANGPRAAVDFEPS